MRRDRVGAALAGVLLVLVLLLQAASARAAEQAVGDLTEEELPGRIGALKEALDAMAKPTSTAPGFLDEQGRAAEQRAFRAYYDYRTEAFEHRRRVFEWQLTSSIVIFVLVVSLVAVGVYFSWLQFRAGLRAGSPVFDAQTTFEASAKGVKVSSPVLGVIILTLSLAFFYLYLVYIYPIEEIL